MRKNFLVLIASLCMLPWLVAGVAAHEPPRSVFIGWLDDEHWLAARAGRLFEVAALSGNEERFHGIDGRLTRADDVLAERAATILAAQTAGTTQEHPGDRRYMTTPEENPKGYEASSVIAAAKNLHGKLLLVHGMMDDNVHMTSTIQLADALQKANLDFEMMLYPHARHGIGGAHVQRVQNDFMKRVLQP